MSSTDVLVVGAGPTGLVLALFLARAGMKPRIIDKNSGPGQASRAMAVQARTLEFYGQLGIADEVDRAGIRMDTVGIWEGGRQAAQVRIGEVGRGLSPYPFVLSYPQDDHERLLGEKLAAAGIAVEWDTELTGFHDDGASVRASLLHAGATEECTAAYLCGCDGAHSAVRQGLGVGFPGGTYEQGFYVADVEAASGGADRNGFKVCLGAKTLCLAFPIRSSGMDRLIGVIPAELTGDNITFEDIRPTVEGLVGMTVSHVNWFATYRVHHRVADHFRVGRAFLSGDAGHIHSPAGGQGMNTGIGDAVNLAWKLAAVLQGRAAPQVLETYETERIVYARSLVETTDRAFQVMVGRGATSRAMRTVLLPHLASYLMGLVAPRRAVFRMVSQTKISYPGSTLSRGSAGDVHGGDRLPWVSADGNGDNFAPLQSVDWQAHVYGEATPALSGAALAAGIPLHAFAWTGTAAKAGLMRNALYLIRPDGYVGLANAGQDVDALSAYITSFGIRTRADRP